MINPARYASQDSFATVVHRRDLSCESQLSLGSDISLAKSQASGVSGVSQHSAMSGATSDGRGSVFSFTSRKSAVAAEGKGRRSEDGKRDAAAAAPVAVAEPAAASKSRGKKQRGGLFRLGSRKTAPLQPLPRTQSPAPATKAAPAAAAPPGTFSSSVAAAAPAASQPQSPQRRGPALPRVATLKSALSLSSPKAAAQPRSGGGLQPIRTAPGREVPGPVASLRGPSQPSTPVDSPGAQRPAGATGKAAQVC